MSSTPVVNLFANIVALTSQSCTAQLQVFDELITGVHFYHGHWVDVTTELLMKDVSKEDKFKRYPAIIVQHDFEETMNPRPGIANNVKLRCVIAYPTKATYTSKERYNATFNNILYLIYDTFIEEMRKSGKFSLKNGKINHKKTDRLYWGRQEANGNKVNQFNEYLDCIDISFDLDIYDFNC